MDLDHDFTISKLHPFLIICHTTLITGSSVVAMYNSCFVI